MFILDLPQVKDLNGLYLVIFHKSSDGYCIQCGRGNTANSTVTITLYKAYRDTNYNVTAGNNTSATYASACACNILNNYQIQLRCGGTTQWMWRTCGYIQ